MPVDGIESEIVKLLVSEWSWEQVLYKIIAIEGLDPWDVDIAALSSAFLKYILKLKTVDFKIPAKYIIIAAILLRMKSDGLKLLPESPCNDVLEIEPNGPKQRFDIPAIQIPTERIPKRGIVIDDLINALKLALSRYEKRSERLKKAIKTITIAQFDITEKIASLYKKIEKLLQEIGNEIKFSSLLKDWNRTEIVDIFIPILHLENEKRIKCRQPKLFEEIYITKFNGKNG
jgi:chromatin segregation and condensation protein Rec8/ScpA/Scc1 (kleisin family)